MRQLNVDIIDPTKETRESQCTDKILQKVSEEALKRWNNDEEEDTQVNKPRIKYTRLIK
jgi:hypothetical protein